jgi:hypothetical protein
MSIRIFISHSNGDSELAGHLVEVLAGMIEGAQVGCSSLPGHEPAGGEDSFAALKQQLGDADVVVGAITARAVASNEVPFQLGAAWALGKRLLLLLGADASATELYLPMGYAEALVLGPEALLELCASIAVGAGVHSEMSPRARAALGHLFPDWHGLDRESSERPIAAEQRDSGTTQPLWPVEPAEPAEQSPQSATAGAAAPITQRFMAEAVAARPGLPSCSASVQAGRAVSDCVFNRDQGGAFADELDVPFGAFLASLGGNWSSLRDLGDLDVWLEAADNLLGTLTPAEQHVRRWYEVGFQLATLLNLAGRELEHDQAGNGELGPLWQAAWSAFDEAAKEAAVEPAAVEELRDMLENLRGPQQGRDYANLGRLQERVRELASRCDSGGMAVSA